MTDTDWITDRLPTEADADRYGRVTIYDEPFTRYCKWWNVANLDEKWRHTSMRGAAAAPTTTPRLFTSITYADDRYLALADDGTAWEDWGQGWVQLDSLPAREVGQ